MYNFTPRTKKRNLQPVFLSVVLVLVLLGAAAFFRVSLGSLLWRGLTPVLHVRTSFGNGIAQIGAQFTSKDSLFKENQTLTLLLASTSAALADRNALYAENVHLKSRFSNTRGVIAGIVARPPLVPYDVLVIDAGARDGVTVGDMVSPGGTTVIGTVSTVYETTSRVTLLSAPGLTYDALLQTSEGKSVPVSVEGQGAGSLRTSVPAGIPVSTGNTVNFSGVSGGFIASVSAVEAPSDQSLQTVYMHLPVNIYSLQYLEVLHVLQR